MAALLAVSFSRMLQPGPGHVVYWRDMVAALAGAAVAAGVAWATDSMRARRLTGRLSR